MTRELKQLPRKYLTWKKFSFLISSQWKGQNRRNGFETIQLYAGYKRFILDTQIMNSLKVKDEKRYFMQMVMERDPEWLY